MANSSFSYQPPAWAFRFLPDPSWSENAIFLLVVEIFMAFGCVHTN